MESSGIISTRGLKSDAIHYGELIFDVNSAYFHNHGGYEFAKQFYADAYKAAVEIVGGEQYILSAVMHADEINRAMTDALGQDVFHYHLHVVYIPVVEKQILWTKRCKDTSLVGTVKETIMQVSRSKKWLSKPALDENGNPILQKNGKPVLKKSYSILQDDFFQFMRSAGYTDVERGERGSNEEHLTVTQFKVAQEQQRLESLTAQVQRSSTELAQMQEHLAAGEAAVRQLETDARKVEKAASAAEKKRSDMVQQLSAQAISFQEIDAMGKKTLTGNVTFTPMETATLKSLAKKGVTADFRVSELEEKLSRAKKDVRIWKERYENLKEQVQPYLNAIKLAPERVRDFLDSILTRAREFSDHRPPAQCKSQDVEL